MTNRLLICAALAALLFASPLRAHEMRPAYLEIRETSPQTFAVLWKVPARGADQRLSLHVRFDDDVEVLGEAVGGYVGNAHVQRWRIRRAGGLAGSTITIDGLQGTFTDVLLRMERQGGGQLTHRLTPDRPAYVVETDPSAARVALTYFELGVEHILLGVDHLLFVLALLLIVSDWRQLVGAITAFTVAHSLTLALASLGLVHVPSAPVEAVIALSIVFVASEIIRGRQGRPGVTARRPWLVSFTFGLLHGFGFAGALTEIGLPQSSIPLALLTFNVGVEAGQLVFVAAVLLLYSVARFTPARPAEWLCRVPAYAVGGMGAFWLVERTVGFWYW